MRPGSFGLCQPCQLCLSAPFSAGTDRHPPPPRLSDWGHAGPLQWHSQVTSLENRTPEIERRLRAMEQAIEGATDARALQARLTMMQGPTIAARKMSRPLPELKQVLIKHPGA